MQTKERRLMECQFVLLLSQLTEEDKNELYDLMQWSKANNPTNEELKAEISRRKQVLS